jgi:outer membrane protein
MTRGLLANAVMLAALSGVAMAQGQQAQPPAAPPVRELTADECVRLGLAHNALKRAAAADAQAAAAVARQARAGRLPTVRSQASYNRLSGNIPDVTFALPGSDTVTTLQHVPLDRYQVEVTAEQTLFAGSRIRNEIRAAAHEASAAQQRASQEEADVAFDVRRTYWELHRAIAARDALASAMERVNAHLADVKSRLREGAALQRDLLQAQTRHSEVRLERLAADNAVSVARLQLDRLLGLPLDVAVRPVTQVEIEESDAPQKDLTQVALAGRPDLAALDEEVRAIRARVSATRGERWPQIGLVGRYVEAEPNPYFFVEQDRFHWNWELGLQATWNVWDGGRRRARETELASRLDAAEARLADAKTQVAVEVKTRQLEMSHAREAVAVAAENVAQAQETFRVARRQFQEGAALSADVLDAEDAWRRAEAQQAQAQADYATAKAAMLGALGQVW